MSAAITVEMRPNEKRQLEDFVPRVVEQYRESGLDEQAESLDETTFVYDPDGWEASLEPSDWGTLIKSLNALRPEEGLRVWWLQKKLARRVQRRVAEMGGEDE